MPFTANLTTEEGLRAHLTSLSVDYSNVTSLTGGNANFLYRVTLEDEKTVIYKHAAPWLHFDPSFNLDPSRMDYESQALQMLPLVLSKHMSQTNVRPAAWCSYNEKEKLLCIEDGGSRNLKSAYTDPKLDIPSTGEDLGNWLAALHTCTTQTPLSLSDEISLEANNPIAVGAYRYSYDGLQSVLAQFSHSAAFGAQINETFGSLLASDNECICHGDFWPGNVLVRSPGAHTQDEDTAVAVGLKLTIVDWEMVRRGTSATDVAQFAAEAFLLDTFHGGRGLRAAFLNSYACARRGDEEDGDVVLGRGWVKRVAVHWGVHVAFWPTSVVWTDREGTRGLVELGVGVLRAAVEEDWQLLRNSELFRGVGGVWPELFDRA
ncbi:kinase-like domain-containing protein [Massariosphaeria phaeospora]|uniref:Kinase-like domain-containing protein n=1 Tax=Massariosphaeria phaeospora TaxID=100035 RepID=A0A7C8M4T2_9PLEO|nr:kinase-like domain-containing protein [Massariosphaeria phaeospora]